MNPTQSLFLSQVVQSTYSLRTHFTVCYEFTYGVCTYIYIYMYTYSKKLGTVSLSLSISMHMHVMFTCNAYIYHICVYAYIYMVTPMTDHRPLTHTHTYIHIHIYVQKAFYTFWGKCKPKTLLRSHQMCKAVLAASDLCTWSSYLNPKGPVD